MDDEVGLTTEAKSLENAKKVKTYHAADWGDYNMNFLIPGTGTAQDVPHSSSNWTLFQRSLLQGKISQLSSHPI